MGRNLDKKKHNLDILKWLLVFVAVGIPFVMRAITVKILGTEQFQFWSGKSYEVDFYSKGKAVLLVSTVVLIIIIGFFRNEVRNQFKSIYKTSAFKLMIGIIALTTASFILSPYKAMSWHGAIDRYEGYPVWISYYAVCLFSWLWFQNQERRNFLTLAISIASLTMAIIGILQYIGVNLLELPIVRDVVLGVYAGHTSMWKNSAVATLYNPNYVGSYCALAIPVSLAVIISQKSWKRYVGMFSMILNLIFLYCSGSRAGVVGLISATVLGLLATYSKTSFSKKTIGKVVTTAISLIMLGGILFTATIYREQLNNLVDSTVGVNYIKQGPLQRYEVISKSSAAVKLDGQLIYIELKDGGLAFFNNEHKRIDAIYDNKTGSIHLQQPYNLLDVRFYKLDSGEAVLSLISKNYNGVLFNVSETEIKMSNVAGYPTKLDKPEHYGFKNMERLGSERGYIWSRTLPLLKKHLLVGSGPDTFITQFPQNEFFAKAYTFGTALMVIDKPHNLYLQIGIGMGLICLIFFIVFCCNALVKLYRVSTLSPQGSVSTCLMMALAGYLITGLFNDSVVSVAPMFWVILGCAYGVYYQSKAEALMN